MVIFSNLNITLYPITLGILISIIITFTLLLASALISGSEVAFFSLSPKQINKLKKYKSRTAKIALKLRNKPEKLLGTILISNNFVNIAIVIFSSYITNSIIDFTYTEKWVSFAFQVVIITFLLLLFGEIIPKVYAAQFSIKFALFMAIPLNFLEKLFRPFTAVLIHSTNIVKKRFHKKQNISINDLSNALDLTSNDLDEDKKILKGIVEFGNIDVKEIKKPRLDVVALEINSSFSMILDLIIKHQYSRIPVYSNSFDSVKGILFIKDLLPHIHKPDNFRWQTLVRPPYFVPENKKIKDLLEEFQQNKVHMAIVVDEYGGTSGIITLEDILEEIVGEINDEDDHEEISYKRISDNTYIFEAKTLLNDFYKILDVNNSIFDDIKGDADTLAGLILEIKGEIPNTNEAISYGKFNFVITEVDNRRIKKIKITHLR